MSPKYVSQSLLDTLNIVTQGSKNFAYGHKTNNGNKNWKPGLNRFGLHLCAFPQMLREGHISTLSSIIASGHLWLLNTWSVARPNGDAIQVCIHTRFWKLNMEKKNLIYPINNF